MDQLVIARPLIAKGGILSLANALAFCAQTWVKLAHGDIEKLFGRK